MRRSLLLFVLLQFAVVCLGSIFVAGFPGFSRLIKNSDLICIVQIAEQRAGAKAIGQPDVYGVYFVKVLSGSAPAPDSLARPLSIGLRYVPYEVDEGGFTVGRARYLVFLKQTENPEVPFENEQVQGTHWEVPLDFDLKKLSGKSVREAVTILLKDLAAQKQRNAAVIEKAVTKALQQE